MTISTRKAFTLVEVLAATVLLSIGLLAVLSAARVASETQARAVNLAIGRNIAQTKIEELRAASFDTLPSSGASYTDLSLPAGNVVKVEVSRYPIQSELNLCRATVTVTWPEQRTTRTVRYETLIVRR